MSDMKEPGQIAFEVYSRLRFGSMPWREIGEQSKKSFAAVEAAVRADERARVIAECSVCQAAEAAARVLHRRALNPSPAAPLSLSVSGQSETPPGAEDQG